MEKLEADSAPKRPADSKIPSGVSIMSEATTLTESQLKCYKHNKLFEAINIQGNQLMCIDCVKESNNKSEKLQISDLSLIIQDKITENIEILERYQTIYSKESSINDLLRKVFKSMHEILYEIEHNKRLELDYIGVGLLKYSSFADVSSGKASKQYDNITCIGFTLRTEPKRSQTQTKSRPRKSSRSSRKCRNRLESMSKSRTTSSDSNSETSTRPSATRLSARCRTSRGMGRLSQTSMPPSTTCSEPQSSQTRLQSSCSRSTRSRPNSLRS